MFTFTLRTIYKVNGTHAGPIQIIKVVSGVHETLEGKSHLNRYHPDTE